MTTSSTRPSPSTTATTRIKSSSVPSTLHRSGPSLSPDGLELEMSKRALIMIKEELAKRDSQLREEITKSKVLTERAKILEVEVNRLLAAQHLPASPPPPPVDPQQPTCHHCSKLVKEVEMISKQLSSVTEYVVRDDHPPNKDLSRPPPIASHAPPEFPPACPAPRLPQYYGSTEGISAWLLQHSGSSPRR